MSEILTFFRPTHPSKIVESIEVIELEIEIEEMREQPAYAYYAY
jgi:hypothetical protein